jgi:hypothetical protein
MINQPPAGGAPKTRLKRLGAYARAHWKELLALGLAAIPAAFLLFHKGTQQAAQTALQYPAALFGSAGGGGDTSGSSSGSSSGSGDGNCPPGSHWVPAGGPAPGSGMKFASTVGHCQPDSDSSSAGSVPFTFGGVSYRTISDAVWKRLHGIAGGSTTSYRTITDAQWRSLHPGYSVKGANPTLVSIPKKGGGVG